jgi:hypothetical protein
MRRLTSCILGAVFLAGGVAMAKLPPPTAEEQAALAAKKAKEDEQLKVEKALLERAQDRVAERYRKTKGASASSGSGQQTATELMPKTTAELPGGVGPKPERPQSAEAHSAPAK